MTGHSHGQGPAPATRRVKLALAAVMAVLAAGTIIALAVLWPKAGQVPQKTAYLAPDASYAPGVVTRLDPGNPAGEVLFRLDATGQEVRLYTVGEVPLEDFQIGDHIKTLNFPDAGAAGGEVYVFQDFYRDGPMLLLALVFALTVLAVARLKGLAAMAGLAGGLALVWLFTVPALVAGKPSLAVALTTASAIMFIVVYLAHGISVKSTTALLGTFLGTAVVASLAWWAVPASHLIPMVDEVLVQLSYNAGGVDLKGVLLCGMVLAGVGVLNDVTITQASAVWELRAAAPSATRRSVFASAMRIGRDHIASTVYTIAFAYIGGALGLLMLASTFDHTVLSLLTVEDIASELVPILVASIGLVLAIPLTTAIGAWLGGGPARGGPAGQGPAQGPVTARQSPGPTSPESPPGSGHESAEGSKPGHAHPLPGL
ncbi:MAG: YibE/F family protein [Bifidobacteriaceae bacterium]|jgi:uncharacterized membrane protein|nr:YibE/F family protein [Bifidobacteriaceae bacterium]